MNDPARSLDRRLNQLRGNLPWLFYATCGLLLLLEFAYTKHPHFPFEGWFGFYPLVGFATTVAIMILAYVVGWSLRRKEDYYDG